MSSFSTHRGLSERSVVQIFHLKSGSIFRGIGPIAYGVVVVLFMGFLFPSALLAGKGGPIETGKGYEATRQFEKALSAYQDAIRLDPNSWEARFRLGDLYRKLGRYKEAVDLLQQTVKNMGKAEGYLSLGDSYAGILEWDQAIVQYHKALSKDPKLGPAYESLADAHLAQRDPEKAVDILKKALGKAHENPYLRYKLALILTNLQLHDDAIEQFGLVIKNTPGFYMAHFNMGVLLGLQEDLKGAERMLKKAISINPNLSSAYYELAKVYERGQKDEKAIRNYLKTSMINSFTGDTSLRLAELYYRMGRYDEAIPFYEKTLDNPAIAYLMQYKLGNIYRHRKEPEKAVEYYRKALKAFPVLFSARYSLALSLMDQKLYKEAAEEFKEVVRLNPRFSSAYFQWGVVQLHLGQKEKAQETLNEYLRQVPEGDFSSAAEILLAKAKTP